MSMPNYSRSSVDFKRAMCVIAFPIFLLFGRFILEVSPKEADSLTNQPQKTIFTSNDVDSLVPQSTKAEDRRLRTDLIVNELSLAEDSAVDLLTRINKIKKCSLYTGWNQGISGYFGKCVQSPTGELAEWRLEEKDISALQKLLIDSHPTKFYDDSKNLNIAIDNAEKLCGTFNYYPDPEQLLQILLEDITSPHYEPLKCKP